MVRVVYAVSTMMYFFGRGGVRHLGNLAGATIFGMLYDRLRVERTRRLTASDEDTQEQVLKVLRRPCLTRSEHALGARR